MPQRLAGMDVSRIGTISPMVLNIFSVSGVCVMREEEFQEHIAHMNRFPRSVPKPVVPYVEPELTLLQTVALLKMNPSTLSRGVAARLLSDADCQDFPSYRDYQELARHRLADKPENAKWHEINASGRARADKITRDKCFELKIHAFIGYGDAGRYEQTFRCACQQWTARRRRSPHAEHNAYTKWMDHVSTAQGIDGLTRALAPPAKAESA